MCIYFKLFWKALKETPQKLKSNLINTNIVWGGSTLSQEDCLNIFIFNSINDLQISTSELPKMIGNLRIFCKLEFLLRFHLNSVDFSGNIR